MIRTIREAARSLGVSEATVRGLVRARKIKPKPVVRQYFGNAKGLDESDMAVLRECLGRPQRAAVRSAP